MDPLSDDVIRRLVTLYGDFIAENGEAIGTPELVLPNGDFFPDDFERDAESVVSLLRRMLTYAPLSADLDIRLRFLEEDEANGSSCGPCGCGPTAKEGSVGSNVTETGSWICHRSQRERRRPRHRAHDRARTLHRRDRRS